MRHAITAVVLVVAAALAFSCTDQPADGYHWYKAFPKLGKYRWQVMGQEQLNAWCDAPNGTTDNGCVVRLWDIDTCEVRSTFTEQGAKKFKPAGTFGGTTLFQHEVWDDPDKPTKGHCAGFEHRETYLRGP